MKPQFPSALENYLLGLTDFSQFTYTQPPKDDPTVKKILDLFIEIQSNYPPSTLEQLHRLPDDLLQKLKTMGFFGLIIPKKYGGLGLSLHQYLSIVEQIVQYDMALAIVCLAHLSIGVKGIMLFGSQRQKEHYLPSAARGDMIFGYALTEPNIGSDAQHITTTAVLSNDGSYYLVNGMKAYITNAGYAGGFTIFAQTGNSQKPMLGAFIIEKDWEGVSIGKDIDKMGLQASSTASIKLHNVKVPAQNLLGTPSDGFKIAMSVLNYGRLSLAAASAGMVLVSLTDMKSRAQKRIQFQQPIINFELIQEKIVHACCSYESITALYRVTASLLEKNPVGYVPLESSLCKLFGTTQAWETLYDALQVAGGAGYLKTLPYEKRMRDFRVATIFEGTTEIHSIYSPLLFSKDMFKIVQSLHLPLKKTIVFIPWLIGLLLQPLRHSFQTHIKIEKKALRMIQKMRRIFRWSLVSALAMHGKNLQNKQFILRRLTQLEVRIYGLSCMLQKIGYIATVSKKHTAYYHQILNFMIEDSTRIINENMNIWPNAQERIFKKFISEHIITEKLNDPSTHRSSDPAKPDELPG